MSHPIHVGPRVVRSRTVIACAIAPVLLAACRAPNTQPAEATVAPTKTSPATTAPTATAASAAAPTELRISTPEGAQVWSAERMNALGASTVPWSHHETNYSYRGVDLSVVCGDAIAQRASKDTDRKTWNRVVVAVGRDGYTALFSAAELRHDWGPTRAWVCFEEGGKPLPSEDGPCRLIVPSDGGGARCVRQLAEIRVVDVSSLIH